MCWVDDSQRFVRVVLAEADDLAIIEREAVFPFREAEAPELEIHVLSTLSGFFCCEKIRCNHWDGTAVEVGAGI